MSKLGAIGSLINHYRYPLVIIGGIAIVVFIDDNSVMQHIRYEAQISDMRAEIKKYREANEADTRQLKLLRRDPHAIERIARERYFMKADDEDIFVLSDDKRTETNKDETTE